MCVSKQRKKVTRLARYRKFTDDRACSAGCLGKGEKVKRLCAPLAVRCYLVTLIRQKAQTWEAGAPNYRHGNNPSLGRCGVSRRASLGQAPTRVVLAWR